METLLSFTSLRGFGEWSADTLILDFLTPVLKIINLYFIKQCKFVIIYYSRTINAKHLADLRSTIFFHFPTNGNA